jgi:hypothetical protein
LPSDGGDPALNNATYQLLMRLHGHFGPRQFGKVAQKFLALAFQLAGFTHVVERGVQGVDVDAAGGPEERYATEVRTTILDFVPFQKKDADGLASRRQDGYQSRLAVLQLRPLSDWYLVHTDSLRVGRLLIDSLRAHRDRELEIRLRPCFDAALDSHFDGAFAGGQGYLDAILREMGVEICCE